MPPSMNPTRALLSTSLVAFVLAISVTTTVSAQTAGDVVCGGCIGSSDLADGAATRQKIRNFTVDGSKLAGSAVSSAKIATGAVTRGKIRDFAVNGAKIAGSAVTTGKIANRAVTATKLAPNAVIPPGGDFADDKQIHNLTLTPEVIQSVTVTAPAAGIMQVHASLLAEYVSGSGLIRCSISTSDVVDFSALMLESGDQGEFRTISQSRGFDVNAGSNVFNLVCEELFGNVRVVFSGLTATYLPQKY